MKKITRKIHLQYFTVFIEKSPQVSRSAPFKPVVQASTVYEYYILSVYIMFVMYYYIDYTYVTFSWEFIWAWGTWETAVQEVHSELPFSSWKKKKKGDENRHGKDGFPAPEEKTHSSTWSQSWDDCVHTDLAKIILVFLWLPCVFQLLFHMVQPSTNAWFYHFFGSSFPKEGSPVMQNVHVFLVILCYISLIPRSSWKILRRW